MHMFERKKLDNRVIKGILVGYDETSAGYLLFIPETAIWSCEI